MTIKQIAQDASRDTDAVLCQLEDGRVFVTLASAIRGYAQRGDETALPAFNRAWVSAPHLFAGPITPRQGAPAGGLALLPDAAPLEPVTQGMAIDMEPADRERLLKIIDQHWPAYFAAPPSLAQKLNLIDAIGARVATRLVKQAVDAGRA